MTTITIALSKGRIFDETLPLLAAAGIQPVEDPERSRKLIIGTSRPESGGPRHAVYLAETLSPR